MTWKKTTFNRNVLYEQIWSESILTVAKSYGISNVALAKICKKLRVPRPWRGYWAKVRNGEPLVTPSLAALRPGEQEEYISRRWERPPSNLGQEGKPERSKKPQPVPMIRGGRRHPLVVRTEAALKRGFVDNYGMLCVTRQDSGCLDIRVSGKRLSRALRIMNLIIRTLEAKGHRAVVVSGYRGEETLATINGQQIQFKLWEWVKKLKPEPIEQGSDGRGGRRGTWRPGRDFERTGCLVLEIEYSSLWNVQGI